MFYLLSNVLLIQVNVYIRNKRPQHNSSLEFTSAHSLSASSYLEDLLEPIPAVICQRTRWTAPQKSPGTWKAPKPSYCEAKKSNPNSAMQPMVYTNVPIQRGTFRKSIRLSPNALHLPVCHSRSSAVYLQIRSTAVPFDRGLAGSDRAAAHDVDVFVDCCPLAPGEEKKQMLRGK